MIDSAIDLIPFHVMKFSSKWVSVRFNFDFHYLIMNRIGNIVHKHQPMKKYVFQNFDANWLVEKKLYNDKLMHLVYAPCQSNTYLE